jgi:hypothetical protein
MDKDHEGIFFTNVRVHHIGDKQITKQNMGIIQTGYKNDLLERTTFDEDCRKYEEENKGFREEYYKHKFSGITFGDFITLLDDGFFDAAWGDAHYLPDFTLTPDASMTYKCSMGGATYPTVDAYMTQACCIRMFEQKFRESIVGDTTSDELIVWYTVLRITDEQFTSNLPLFMSRLMEGQTI